MSSGNLELMRRWFDEVWNQGRPEAIEELLADPCRVHDLDEGEICCPADFKVFHEKINVALSNISVTIDHAIEAGDKVAGIATVQATHKATGQPVSFKTSFFSVIADGKAVEAWNVTDFLPMLIQTGLLPIDTIPKGLQGENIA